MTEYIDVYVEIRPLTVFVDIDHSEDSVEFTSGVLWVDDTDDNLIDNTGDPLIFNENVTGNPFAVDVEIRSLTVHTEVNND